MLAQPLHSFFDELEKIAEGQTTVVIKTPGPLARKKEEKGIGEKGVHYAKGFAAGALPTAAAVRYLIPTKDIAREGEKAVRTFGVHPNLHSKLQLAAGLTAGTLGLGYAAKHRKPSQVMVQL
jgi:hypothetical protein